MENYIDFWISPNYKTSDFEFPLSIEDKITLFSDRVMGWKLKIADTIINGGEFQQIEGSISKNTYYPKLPHSGYAVIDILFSYFEMIGKFVEGYEKKGKSEHYCKIGLSEVFPPLFCDDATSYANIQIRTTDGKVLSVADYIIKILYEDVRCGLYHSGIAEGPVVLSAGFETPLAFYFDRGLLYINPHILVKTLINHFDTYLNDLKNPENVELRKNFQKRFDFQDRY